MKIAVNDSKDFNQKYKLLAKFPFLLSSRVYSRLSEMAMSQISYSRCIPEPLNRLIKKEI